LLQRQPFSGPPWPYWASWPIATALHPLLAYTLFIASMRYIEASRASITATLEPVMAATFAYFVLGETLEPLQLLGGAMVLGAILMLSGRAKGSEG